MALKFFKHLILEADMFCSSELLRYNSQTQYKTLTGGIFSLGIICVILAGFTNMIADTLNRTSISSSLTTNKLSDPPFATLVPGNDTMFMFGLQIQSFDVTFQADLTNGPQYFYVETIIFQIENGVFTGTKASLEQCTKQHWAMMPQFLKGFDSFQVNKWLCPPIGYVLPIQGGYTSPKSYQIEIKVYTCKNSTSDKICASQQDIDALFKQYQNFYCVLNYINPVISPNQQQFLSHYIEGNDYVIFSSKIGSEAWVYLSDYTIKSDDSIWPFSKYSVQKGLIAQTKAINHPYAVVGDNSSLASVYFAKSSNSLVYSRQVQKISAVFSYIGGLVGAITAVLFLLKAYTDVSLEISIGIKLFQVNKQESESKGMFTFVGFIQLTIYRILKFFGQKGSSEWPQRLDRFQKEAIKQLDIELLLRRLIKLETCMTQLFTPEQLEQIREGQTITLDSAKRMRLLLLKEGSSALTEQCDKEAMMDKCEGSLQRQMQDYSIKQGISKQDSVTSIRKHCNLNDQNDPQVLRAFDISTPMALEQKKEQIVIPEMNNKSLGIEEVLPQKRQRNGIFPQNHNILPPIKRKCINVHFSQQIK